MRRHPSIPYVARRTPNRDPLARASSTVGPGIAIATTATSANAATTAGLMRTFYTRSQATCALENVDRGGAPPAVEPLEPDRDRATARPPAHDDHGLDHAVPRLAGHERAEGERRTGGDLALGLASASAQHDALEEVPVDVVGDPAGDLLEVAGSSEDLDDAPGEVLDQRIGTRKRSRRCGLLAEVLVGRDAQSRRALRGWGSGSVRWSQSGVQWSRRSPSVRTTVRFEPDPHSGVDTVSEPSPPIGVHDEVSGCG